MPTSNHLRAVAALSCAAHALLWLSRAAAAPKVDLDCASLSSEDASQVEARVLATLLALDRPGLRLALRCPGQVATAELDWDGGRLSKSSTGATLREAFLDAVDLALAALPDTRSEAAKLEPSQAEVAKPEAAPAAVQTQNSAERRAPKPAPELTVKPSAHSPVRPPAEALAVHPRLEARPAGGETRWSTLQFQAAGQLESWDQGWALGASLGFERFRDTLWYGFSLGALTNAHEEDRFRAMEGHAGVDLGIQPRGLFGARARVTLGLSALMVDPHNGAALTGGATAFAGFIELELNRPIWFGSVALLPGIGARGFTAARQINVDQREQLRLWQPLFHATLGVLYRTDD